MCRSKANTKRLMPAEAAALSACPWRNELTVPVPGCGEMTVGCDHVTK